MRPVLTLLLALVVALSSVTMAAARHQARPADHLVLCAGIGMVVLEVDGQGNPIGPMLPCPDCTPPLQALDTGAAALPGPALRLVALEVLPVETPGPAPASGAFHWSRGPPVSV